MYVSICIYVIPLTLHTLLYLVKVGKVMWASGLLLCWIDNRRYVYMYILHDASISGGEEENASKKH